MQILNVIERDKKKMKNETNQKNATLLAFIYCDRKICLIIVKRVSNIAMNAIQ